MKYLLTYRMFESRAETELIWIHGLPGSGKSHLIQKIIRESEFEWSVFDDTAGVEEILASLQAGKRVILASPYFEDYIPIGLGKRLRSSLADLDQVTLREVWFSNDPEQCIENVLSRKGHTIAARSIVSEIPTFSRNYMIPDGVVTEPVWQARTP